VKSSARPLVRDRRAHLYAAFPGRCLAIAACAIIPRKGQMREHPNPTGSAAV